MPTSPSVNNYRIGKGIVSFKPTGAGTYIDLGNAPSFVYTPAVEKLEHFSSREGVKTKDFTAITTIAATIKLTLDEITPENLAPFVLGTIGTDTDGNTTIAAMTKAEYTGEIKVVGTNDIGQHVGFDATVSFVPDGDFRVITDQDEFDIIELSAEVMKSDDGSFGMWTIEDTTA